MATPHEEGCEIARWTDRLVVWPQYRSAWTKRVHRKPRGLVRVVGMLVTWVRRRPVVHRSGAAALHADAAQLRQFSRRAGFGHSGVDP
jgi:hypothetical protein